MDILFLSMFHYYKRGGIYSGIFVCTSGRTVFLQVKCLKVEYLGNRLCILEIVFLNFIYFFIQQVLISHPFYAHQCIHVNPNLPIHHTTTTSPHCFPPLVSVRLFSTSVSQLLPYKPVHLYHFSRFHVHTLLYDICFSLSDILHSV